MHGVVPFTQPTTDQGRFVTSCEVVSAPGRTFGEGGREVGREGSGGWGGGGGGMTEAIRTPPYLPGTEFLMSEVLANARAA